MQKIHLTNDGELRPCGAHHGRCPYGEDRHFTNMRDASEAQEAYMQEKFAVETRLSRKKNVRRSRREFELQNELVYVNTLPQDARGTSIYPGPKQIAEKVSYQGISFNRVKEGMHRNVRATMCRVQLDRELSNNEVRSLAKVAGVATGAGNNQRFIQDAPNSLIIQAKVGGELFDKFKGIFQKGASYLQGVQHIEYFLNER